MILSVTLTEEQEAIFNAFLARTNQTLEDVQARLDPGNPMALPNAWLENRKYLLLQKISGATLDQLDQIESVFDSVVEPPSGGSGGVIITKPDA